VLKNANWQEIKRETEGEEMLSIIIVNWNVKEYLEKCLESIPEIPDYEIIVVDNASKDGSCEMVKAKFPKVKLIASEKNLGFAAGNNLGLKSATGDFLLFLNPDTIILADAIEKLLGFLISRPKAGAVAPRLVYPDKSLQPSCLSFPTLGAMFARTIFLEGIWPSNPITKKYLMKDFDYGHEAQIDQPMGACIMVKKEVLDKVGIFDEHNFMFFDEVDLCHRIKKAGFEIWFTPSAEIVHHLSKSVNKWGTFNLSKNWTKSRNYYFSKHYGFWALVLLYFFDFLRILLIAGILFALYKAVLAR